MPSEKTFAMGFLAVQSHLRSLVRNKRRCCLESDDLHIPPCGRTEETDTSEKDTIRETVIDCVIWWKDERRNQKGVRSESVCERTPQRWGSLVALVLRSHVTGSRWEACWWWKVFSENSHRQSCIPRDPSQQSSREAEKHTSNYLS